jgi:hypothetical protein
MLCLLVFSVGSLGSTIRLLSEHLQWFGIILLANLDKCQVTKIFAK